jgi:hypothetical protein
LRAASSWLLYKRTVIVFPRSLLTTTWLVVPPAETCPVLLARGPYPTKLDEVSSPFVGQLADADGPGPVIQSNRPPGSVYQPDLMVLDVDALLHPPTSTRRGCLEPATAAVTRSTAIHPCSRSSVL